MNTLNDTFNQIKSHFPFSIQAEQKRTLSEVCKNAIFNDFHINLNFNPSIIASNGIENVFTCDFDDSKLKSLRFNVWIQNASKKIELLFTKENADFTCLSAFDLNDRWVWLLDKKSNIIFRIDQHTKRIISQYGNCQGSGSVDGIGENASFCNIGALTVMKNGDALIVESGRIRKIEISSGNVSTIKLTQNYLPRNPTQILLSHSETIAYVISGYIILSVDFDSGISSHVHKNVRPFKTSKCLMDSNDKKIFFLYKSDPYKNEYTHELISLDTLTLAKNNLTTNNGDKICSFSYGKYLDLGSNPLESNTLIICNPETNKEEYIKVEDFSTRLQSKKFALVSCIKVKALTRLLKGGTRSQVVQKLVLHVLAGSGTYFTPSQFETLYNFNLFEKSNRTNTIKGLLFNNDELLKSLKNRIAN